MAGGCPRIDLRVGVLTLFLLLVVFAGGAQAAPETIAEYGEDVGKVREPLGLAVDRSNGDFYVADGNNFRIDKFDEQGNFLFAWGWGVRDGLDSGLQTCGPQAAPPSSHCFKGLASATGPGAVAPSAVAVEQSTGDVYVTDPEKRRVSKFTSSGAFVFMVGRNVNKTKVALGGAATQAEKNLCTAASGDECGSGEEGSGAAEFTNSISTVAVSSTGVVWVGDQNRLTSFDSSSGAAGAQIALAGASYTRSLALDSSDDFYVISAAVAGVRKLEAGTGTPLETLDAGGQPRTVTLDGADNVFVGDQTTPYRFKVYDSAGNQTSQFGAGQVIGEPGAANTFGGNAIAVGDAAGKLYAASSRTSEAESVVQAFPLPEPGPLVEDQGVKEIEPTTATLTATINPENEQTTYHFEYGINESYGHSTPPQTLTAEEFEAEDVAVGIEGLTPSTTYHFRVVASNECEPVDNPGHICTVYGPDQTFTTMPAVVIEAEWASSVSAHSATLNAEMNPLGVEAEAWLEWGTGEGYGQVVPLANLGEGFAPVLRQATLTGLQASTTYHYRFAAKDERSTCPEEECIVHGEPKSFTTQFGGLGFQLADGRAWEMVSPPDKHGARLVGGGEIDLQASADGNGLAYQSYLSTETDPEGNRLLEPSMNLARRQADGSWRSKDITPPNEVVTPISLGLGTEYKLFSADLSEAIVDPRSGTPLSPEASERTPYLRENTEPPLYTPLATGKEPYANVPPGTEFGGGQDSTSAVQLVAASADFRHFGLRSRRAPLVEAAPSGGETLYEWSGGQIEAVSVLPPSEGGEIVRSQSIGSDSHSVHGAVSEGGSRVFWTGESPKHLYLRYNATEAPSAISGGECTEAEKGCTAQVDVKQPGATGTGAAEPVFQGASADGSVVFFTDPQRLTEDASSRGADLYRCEIPPGAASGCATLTDVSVPTGARESAEVQGLAAGISDDGTRIYFVAKGVLDEAPNKLGDAAVLGQPNLYLWQQGGGVRFISTLADEDGTDWASFARVLTAAASPSGRYLSFMSQRSLTGYDNRDAFSGEAAQEVFRYDAATEQLGCVSCNPAGARPRSAVPSQDFGAFVDPWKLWAGRPVAAGLPEATSATVPGVSLYRPRSVLDNGRVFFNAVDSLVPADSNGQWDVYQYETTGVGGCSATSGGASISRSAEGCVSLISSGTGEEEAAFLDASKSGDDAFFWSPAQLNETDTDHEVDVYDARVGGIPATLPKITECLGEACQPAAQAPNDPTPASSAFNGAGNVKPARKRCGKGKRLVRHKGHRRCVKKHRRHSHHRKHRRAPTHGRAQR